LKKQKKTQKQETEKEKGKAYPKIRERNELNPERQPLLKLCAGLKQC